MSIDPSRFVTPLLLIFVWGATGAAVAAPPDRKACVEFLTRELDENHVDRSGIDLAAHCEEFAGQVRAGASGAEEGRWRATLSKCLTASRVLVKDIGFHRDTLSASSGRILRCECHFSCTAYVVPHLD